MAQLVNLGWQEAVKALLSVGVDDLLECRRTGEALLRIIRRVAVGNLWGSQPPLSNLCIVCSEASLLAAMDLV